MGVFSGLPMKENDDNLSLCDLKTSHEVDIQKEETYEFLIVFITFVFLGNSALSFCTFFFLILGSLNSLVLAPFQNSLLVTYTTFSLICGCSILLFWRNKKLPNIIVCSIIFSIFSLFFSLSLTYIKNNVIKSICIHIICGIGGCWTFVFQKLLYEQASNFPRYYLDAISLGFGLSGMFGFISWLIISQIFFPMSKDILKAIWIQTLCCVVTSNVLGLCLWVYIHSSQWITTPIQKDKKLATTLLLTDVENLSQDSVQGQPTTEQCLPSSSLQEKINNQNDSHVVSHFFVTCFTQFKYYSTSLQQTFNISLTLLITFLIYPTTAPLAWSPESYERTLLTGIFLFGDFIGRYLPNLKQWCPFLALKCNTVIYYGLMRLIFIPWMIFLKTNKMSKVQGILLSEPFRRTSLFLFSLSNGWLCSLSNMYVMVRLKTSEEKEFMSTVYTLCLLVGISLGSWLAPLL